MTALTTPTPLVSYQQGRDKILATVLDAVSGLEGVVLDFQHAHEGNTRAIGFELSEARREQARLEGLLGEQALELESARRHVCPALPVTDGFGFDQDAPALEVAAPAAVAVPAPAVEINADAEAASLTIEGLRASLQEQERLNANLNADLAAERQASAGLREDLAKRDARIATLEGEAIEAGTALTAATETHQDYVRAAEKNFEQRLSTGVRAAENGVRAEAVRIVEAIAADNPGLAEAADLFTVAFPAEAAPADKGTAARAPQTVPAAEEPPATAMDTKPGLPVAPPVSEEDFLDNIPSGEPDDGPAPLTQAYLPAPDLSEDAILDPDFFTTPQTLDAPADEDIDAPAPEEASPDVPKPSYGLFGRKKEEQNA